ncbi:ATP-binding protein [Pseudoduganella buxea]|uniref:Transcriptional regulator n=3 Tax=Pseudoduganella buxea TaxID=1949069 RepID=A0ABQ1K9E4_9BURK|nr:winged helix-turn-helix domain-containing protein [Pseudoduganella buxea]GGB88820.1 transcriptional regulator [Pseudoduganella buxea]
MHVPEHPTQPGGEQGQVPGAAGDVPSGFAFGDFHLVPHERALYRAGQPLRLAGRAFDVLLALVERAGTVVGKDELIARVWPHTVVEEGNLRVHVGALRKVLGADQAYVDNVVGRGYCFVAPVVPVAPAAPAPLPPAVPDVQLPGLPRQRLVGRDDVLAQLAAQAGAQRLLTVVGPGGMGKTSVALAVAARLAPAFDGQVRCADLAALADPELLAGTLAQLVGVPPHGDVPAGGMIVALADWLRERRLLLVLDGCEHLIDAVAALAERVLREAPRVHILATSREPLRAQGEWVHRLAPLAVPPRELPATPVQLANCASVQLFAERAGADGGGFTIDEGNAQAVADICRRLDGIPLAIELAAGRAAFFGVHELALRLSDCFAVLTRGRRTALPRHQTLRATLDWSHDMLCPEDRAVLRRLAVFRGGFTLAAAAEVAHGPGVGPEAVFERIANLAAKSLVGVEPAGAAVQYRLLDTTRSYALEKLDASGEGAMASARHARFHVRMLTAAQDDWQVLAPAQWLRRHGHCIDHVRAALDWAFGPEGDAAVGIELAVVSAPLWYQLALLDEYRARLEPALARSECAPHLAPALHLALGHALLHVAGDDAALTRAKAFATAQALAEQAGVDGGRAEALWGRCTDALLDGDYRQAAHWAARRNALTGPAPDTAATQDMLLARTLHYLGDQRGARRQVDLPVPAGPGRRANVGRADERIAALALRSRVLWLQGQPDQAGAVAAEAVRQAQALEHDASLCYALLSACPVALWRGDIDVAGTYADLMAATARRGNLARWLFWARLFRVGLARQGGAKGAEPADTLARHALCTGLHLDMLGTLHERLLTPAALARAEAGDAGWAGPELLRCWGEQVGRIGARAQAEGLFRRALALAGDGGALAWQLRAATSLARLLRGAGRGGEGARLLAPVLERCTEGQGTRDVAAAHVLLAAL